MRLFAVIAVLFSFLSCRIQTDKPEKELIVCSTSIIADCVKEIVGDQIEVVSLMGPGVDPHAYNPRPSDVKYLNNASVIIYSGFHLEGKMAELFERLSERKKVIEVAHYFDQSAKIEADTGIIDPHIWFRATAWIDAFEPITLELIDLFPAKSKQFDTNYQSLKKKVYVISKEGKKQLEEIPIESRVLITSHDAFHYFGKEFGIEVKALQGISTTQEPGVKDVIELVDFIVKRKVKALFVEHSVSPKAIQTVIYSCKRKGHLVQVGGLLYSDALGEKQKLGGSYFGMLQHNIQTILLGLKEK
jgi:manganese/zinc/iron transport system substrate-binding protein